jgi:hypothetical protein
MLRESSLANSTPLDLAAINDRTLDPLTPGGLAILDLVDATLGVTQLPHDMALRRALADFGAEAVVDMAAVFATFEMMNRVADGTGIPMGRGRLASTAEVRTAAGIDHLYHG